MKKLRDAPGGQADFLVRIVRRHDGNLVDVFIAMELRYYNVYEKKLPTILLCHAGTATGVDNKIIRRRLTNKLIYSYKAGIIPGLEKMSHAKKPEFTLAASK